MIKLLCHLPYFRRKILKIATEIKFNNLPNQDKLEYCFTDSTGVKWFKWIDETLMPIARYDQMQIILMEIDARIGRDSLTSWLDKVSKILEKNNTNKIREEVGYMVGMLKQRLSVLHDPEMLLRLISCIYITEDQLNKPEVWNEKHEEDKFNRLKADQRDHLYNFLKKNGLTFHLKSANITAEEYNKYLQVELQHAEEFKKTLNEIGSTLNQK